MRNQGVLYPHTNENLKAVVAGLDPQESDTILAIAGSGDQALALLEYAGKVVAVDSNPAQIRFVEKRVSALRRGDYREFFNDYGLTSWTDLVRRNIYFRGLSRNSCRLEHIRERLDRLELIEGDIFQVAKERKDFNKLYLSNLSSWGPFSPIWLLPDNLTEGCVVYSAGMIYPEPPGLAIDETLTSRARKLNSGWNPSVYRKVFQSPATPISPATSQAHPQYA